MTKYQSFTEQQLAPRLYAGETILATGTLNTKDFSKFIWKGMWALVGDGHYMAAVTPHRILLIQTTMGPTGLKMANEGVTEIACADIASVQTTGGMIERTLNLSMKSGATLTYNLNSLPNFKDGQKAFVDTLTSVVAGGQRGTIPAPPAAASSQTPNAPATPPASGMSVADQIKELAILHQAGVLTDEEYNATKAELLKRL